MVKIKGLINPTNKLELINDKLTLSKDSSIKRWYSECYEKFFDTLNSIPLTGVTVELGSGAGFIKEYNDEIVTTDVFEHDNIDRVVDATNMPFKDHNIRAFFLLNVFHHIPDVELFLNEVQRCLIPGGKVLIIDQHVGLISKIILNYAHDEFFEPKALNWSFKKGDPLRCANGALTWIVFKRDKDMFCKKFKDLKINYYKPHTPFRYWLSGGLKKWSLLPVSFFKLFTLFDNVISKFFPNLCSFVSVEIEKMDKIS